MTHLTPDTDHSNSIPLTLLPSGVPATVVKIQLDTTHTQFRERAMEMGITPGAKIEVTHFAPFGGTLAVLIRGTLIAMRSENAKCIYVTIDKETKSI